MPASRTESPRMALPEKFDGSTDRCHGFLRQCDNFFTYQPEFYGADITSSAEPTCPRKNASGVLNSGCDNPATGLPVPRMPIHITVLMDSGAAINLIDHGLMEKLHNFLHSTTSP
ncbi:hypothetical protein QTP86_025767, partial [Hemibagrus guttatus]